MKNLRINLKKIKTICALACNNCHLSTQSQEYDQDLRIVDVYGTDLGQHLAGKKTLHPIKKWTKNPNILHPSAKALAPA